MSSRSMNALLERSRPYPAVRTLAHNNAVVVPASRCAFNSDNRAAVGHGSYNSQEVTLQRSRKSGDSINISIAGNAAKSQTGFIMGYITRARRSEWAWDALLNLLRQSYIGGGGVEGGYNIGVCNRTIGEEDRKIRKEEDKLKLWLKKIILLSI